MPPRNPFLIPSVYYMEEQDVHLEELIEGCRKNHRASQQRLFAQFYNYAMTIARRYSGQVETAEEVVSDSFFKVFSKIHLYTGVQPFRFWLRRVVINTAIDQFRSELHSLQTTEIQPWHDMENDPGIVESLTREQILSMLDQLPPAYRTVFNLFVVDGFSHEEIAATLGISVGASKSNLARARQHLRTFFSNDFEFSRKA